MQFSNFKTNEQGLVPVVTQDALTNEVLMVAYMNEEAYQKTLETKKAHYYSRSRQQLWFKGETSGHIQHVQSVLVDCDEDTLILKVRQEGAACHTGNFSCFYREILTADDLQTVETVTSKVLEEVYQVVVDRKLNPKEGSYTNYLFDKGIDKILKKVGEETAEVIIGAKNEGCDEIIYEISDLLYHLTVLLVEKGANWNQIFKELAKRR
ncbi:MAG: bifunctional phosphoribosyl-AMP cyclohydrolase/phosphoribosyl-ATP diphosphatase HisIE [Vallitaleaceae bacterium]|nr:bifunctional phosphoribosyl-AMP cyclohydrolase/phosphoribosyl-ATP diphosphatase HisIE [Vallitaleaceae bacterium]